MLTACRFYSETLTLPEEVYRKYATVWKTEELNDQTLLERSENRKRGKYAMKNKECVKINGKMDGLGEHAVYRYHDDITGETFQIGLMGRTSEEVVIARNKFIRNLRENYTLVCDVNNLYYRMYDAIKEQYKPGAAKLIHTKGVMCPAGAVPDEEKFELNVNREYLLLVNVSCDSDFWDIRRFYGKTVGECFDNYVAYVNKCNNSAYCVDVCNKIDLEVLTDEPT